MRTPQLLSIILLISNAFPFASCLLPLASCLLPLAFGSMFTTQIQRCLYTL
ncbi:hypothetical protein [Moorena sp. SIOASIH]|uniref:hypothetical protein n=1 Tax=Moorena sp. SIOASIH TaxID=2607817 RepID=UPI0025EB9F15|nr:hypothetical protein [Moorena sp. SIOASIH]